MSPAPADLLIRGGTVIDGTGKAPLSADVAIKDGRIAYVGPRWPGTADRVLEAAGLWVTPGFYRHPQSFRFYFAGRPSGDEFDCPRGDSRSGGQLRPRLRPPNRSDHRPDERVRVRSADYPIDWRSVGQYLERLQERQPAVNVLTLVPNGRLRLGRGRAGGPAFHTG